MERIIFHIDVNSAFLSWEAIYRLHVLGEKQDLRDIPSAVGGDIAKRHGIILAKSMPAKAYGIKTGDTIAEALKKCPDLVTVAPHYDLYDKCSNAFMDILREFSPCVEQYSVDEAYMDMTGTQSLFGSPIVVANMIKDKIRMELGFTVNVGVSSNKLLAKMAGDFKKPDLVHTLFPSEIKKKMWPLPVSELFYVGAATKRKLYNLGIFTIGDLANTQPLILKKHFGKHGELICAFANGIDISVVENEVPANKGYGNSTTIAFDVDRPDIAKIILLSLSETVCARLRADNVMASVVAVSVTDCFFHHESHQITMVSPTNITNEIHATACRLLEEVWNGTPVRKLGIHTSKVTPSSPVRQLNMFDMDMYEDLLILDYTTDMIREKYGNDSIMRAVFVNNPVYHMSGGISKDKKRPNYGGGIAE